MLVGTNPSLTWTGALLLALAACGGEKLRPRCVQGPGSNCEVKRPAGSEQPAADASGNNATQAGTILEELRLLEAWNQGLCQRLNQQTLECPASAPLIPRSNSAVLNCSSSAGQAKVIQNYSLLIDAGGGSTPSIPVSLLASGGKFRSPPVSGPSPTVFNWQTSGSNGSDSPRFVDVMSLYLRDEYGKLAGEFKLENVRQFELRVQDQTLLTRSDLVSDSSGGVSVSLSSLERLRQSPACTVSAAEIESIRIKAKESLSKGEQANSKATQKERESENQLPALRDNLEREQARNRALQRALGQDVTRGCWAEVPLKTLEIIVDGGPGGVNGEIEAGKSGSPKTSTGSPDSYSFELGDLLKVAATNAADSPLFRPEGRVMRDDFASQPTSVGDLRYLKITRGGVSYNYESAQECEDDFFSFQPVCNTVFYNRQIGVTNLQRLRVLVNGQVAYDRDNINHTFANGSLVFTDNDFRSNRAWQVLMSRNDCGLTRK